MADTAKRDGNFVTTLLGTSNTDGTPVTIYADPVTHRLLVDIAAGQTSVDNETPTGTINGSNTAFTLAQAPSPAASLQLFLNGALQTAGGEDYTLTSTTITFVSAPLTSSILRAYYRY